MKHNHIILALAAAASIVVSCNLIFNPEKPEEKEEEKKEETVKVSDITLSETDIAIVINEERTLVATVSPDNATDPSVTWSTDNSSVATVSAGTVKGIGAGNATITAKAGSKTASCTVTVSIEPKPVDPKAQTVDMGLSVKWAGWNVGATKPEEFGDAFCWGETQPKESYWQNSYKLGAILIYGQKDKIYKYNTNAEYGTVDNLTRLLPEDDAATANWGAPWRMPTDAEKTELLAGTEHKKTEFNGVPGWIFTSKINGASIFLPATGYRYQSSRYYAGEETMFWTSTVNSDSPYMAHIACNWIGGSSILHEAGFEMDPVSSTYHLSEYRCYGLPVRAVCNK